MTNLRKAGGCSSAGSRDATFAATLKVIGVGFFFEITFGEKPPLYCTSRSPTTNRSHGAAIAMPATTSAIEITAAAVPRYLPQDFFITTSRGRPYVRSAPCQKHSGLR